MIRAHLFLAIALLVALASSRASGQTPAMPPAAHEHHAMPGMLTPQQLAQLDAAKGTEFDRQFLILMIQHHQGALRMVTDLFATPRAAQDVDVSVFANDVQSVQTAEIGIMHQMLDEP